jgi:hypothetical protein
MSLRHWHWHYTVFQQWLSSYLTMARRLSAQRYFHSRRWTGPFDSCTVGEQNQYIGVYPIACVSQAVNPVFMILRHLDSMRPHSVLGADRAGLGTKYVDLSFPYAWAGPQRGLQTSQAALQPRPSHVARLLQPHTEAF